MAVVVKTLALFIVIGLKMVQFQGKQGCPWIGEEKTLYVVVEL